MIITRKKQEIVLTKEQLEKLKPFEEYFRTIYYHQYKRASTMKENRLLGELYQEIFNKEPKGLKSGCSKCIYDVYQEVATQYYKWIEIYSKEEEKEVKETEDYAKDETRNSEEKTKGKRSHSKKTDEAFKE